MTDEKPCGWFKHEWSPWHYLHGNLKFRTCQKCGHSQTK